VAETTLPDFAYVAVVPDWLPAAGTEPIFSSACGQHGPCVVRTAYPVCTGGERACPPEDGGCMACGPEVAGHTAQS